MPTLHRLQFPIALCALAVLAHSQNDTNSGRLAGTGGLLAVDAATTGTVSGRLLTKDAGYYTTTPTERAPITGAPDFRAQSLFAGLPVPLEIDAFSIGMDWIVSDGTGQCWGPEWQWAVLLFSVTRGTTGALGGPINYDAASAADGAAGDLFCYEFTSTTGVPLSLDTLTKALDSTTINIHPTAGTSNMTAFDYFASMYANADLLKTMPTNPTVYFSVSSATAPSIPTSWLGGSTANRSGATVFRMTWKNNETWGPPSVYLSPSNLGLLSTDDVDALAVDTLHHPDNYVLFSQVSPPAGQAIKFLNRTTGIVYTYRYANSGPTIESRLGLGASGDVDALCAIDPGEDALTRLSMAVDANEPPSVWPISPSQPGPVEIFVARKPGSSSLHGYGTSDNHTNTIHRWQVRLPDNPGGPVFLPPTTVPRTPIWKGWPSQPTFPMNPSMLDRRVQFGVEEVNTVTLQSISSRFVEITEWAEREPMLTAPTVFASAEGGTSGNVWRGTANRVQCLYDSTNFTNQGVVHLMQIDELEWRQAGELPGASITYPNVNLYLGYAQTDYASPSTTFSANRTPSHTLVYSGQVQVVPAARATPNRFTIRVKLQTPFIYDPTLNQDLLLEIESLTSSSPATSSTMSTSFLSPQHLANTVRSLGTTGASTGAISPFCPVCRFHYDIPAAAATETSYGTGCYADLASFYERFPPGWFDLSGSPVQSILLTPSNGGYAASAGSNSWYTPLSSSLNLVDDSVATVSLPMSFAYPGGITTQLTVCSNGFVTLNGTSTNTDFTPTAAALLGGEPRFCPCWADLLPNPSNNVYAEFDGVNTYYVTWLNVPTFTSPGAVTMQLAMNLATGTVEYRWQSCSLPSSLSLVGWSPGTPSSDPGERDVSNLPFSTPGEHRALLLTAMQRPITGTTINYTISNIAPTAFFSALMQNFGGVDPGIHLGFLGLPGCRLFVSFPVPIMTVLFGSPATMPFSIPNVPSLVGIEVDNQAAAWIAGVNPFGAVTSNGLVTRVGSL